MKRTIKANGVTVSVEIPFGSTLDFQTTQRLLGSAKKAKFKQSRSIVVVNGEFTIMDSKLARELVGDSDLPTTADEAVLTGARALETALSALSSFYGVTPAATPATARPEIVAAFAATNGKHPTTSK